ncbi:MAG: hypothetical protein RL660_5 [Bacteroidota bacterium]|jgi:hypothetical protein
MRSILKRSAPSSYTDKIRKASIVLRGWANYFRLTEAPSTLVNIDGFIRKRCRIVIWVQCKRIRSKYKLLRRHGIAHDKAYQWANSSKGAARIARSPILQGVFDKRTLRTMGLLSLEEYLFTNRNLQLKFTF